MDITEKLIGDWVANRRRLIKMNDNYENYWNKRIVNSRRRTVIPTPPPPPPTFTAFFDTEEDYEGLSFTPAIRVNPSPVGQPGVGALIQYSLRDKVATWNTLELVKTLSFDNNVTLFSIQLAIGNFNDCLIDIIGKDENNVQLSLKTVTIGTVPTTVTFNSFSNVRTITFQLKDSSEETLAAGAVQTFINVNGRPRPVGYEMQLVMSDIKYASS